MDGKYQIKQKAKSYYIDLLDKLSDEYEKKYFKNIIQLKYAKNSCNFTNESRQSKSH